MYIVIYFTSSWFADGKDVIHVVWSEVDAPFHYLILGTWTMKVWTVCVTILNKNKNKTIQNGKTQNEEEQLLHPSPRLSAAWVLFIISPGSIACVS